MYLILARSQNGGWTPRFNQASPVMVAEVAKKVQKSGAAEVIVYLLEPGTEYTEEDYMNPERVHHLVVFHFKLEDGVVWVTEGFRKLLDWVA